MPTNFREDYATRVYAGVLGKAIGVYVGRPFEQWPYERIAEVLGDVRYYVHEQLGHPLIVADDDLSGTFGFLRAVEDYGLDVSAAQLGQHWLNEIIEGKTVLWWGGMGTSTEHTAYLRLRQGVPAPESGSIARNGARVAEQIGAQIFIDGWGLLNPGDPERAAEMARRAGSVSHDGVALDGAVAVASMVARGFDLTPGQAGLVDDLLDTATRFLPSQSLLREVYGSLREWHSAAPGDWRATRERLRERYGYERFEGGCHMVPNHAVILLGLLYGGGDFTESMHVTCTAAYDTDCNAGNVGCILGVAQGLAAFETGPDWRGPVADRMILPTAEGGLTVTDCAREALRIVHWARHGGSAGDLGPRFSFPFPGSVQGWRAEAGPVADGVAQVVPVDGGIRLEVRGHARGRVARASAPTWLELDQRGRGGYSCMASPTFSPGQGLRAELRAAPGAPEPARVRLVVAYCLDSDETQWLGGPGVDVASGTSLVVEWTPELDPRAVVIRVGLEVMPPEKGRWTGAVELASLAFMGEPHLLVDAHASGSVWREQWVDATDGSGGQSPLTLIQNRGEGSVILGGRDWTDLMVKTSLWLGLATSVSLRVRVQGQHRWVGLSLDADGRASLVESTVSKRILAEGHLAWDQGDTVELWVRVQGDRVEASARHTTSGDRVDLTGTGLRIPSGGVGIEVTEGRVDWSQLIVDGLPASSASY